MSTTRHARAKFTAKVKPTRRTLIRNALGPAVRGWVSSGELSEITAPTAGRAVDIQAVDALRARLEALPHARSLVDAVDPANLAAAELSLERARVLADNGASAAQIAEAANVAGAAFVRAVDATIGRIRIDERVVVSEAFRQTLTSEHYTIEEASGTRSQGLVARRGHEVLAVLVHDGGAVDLDVAGLADGRCADTIDAVHDGLARQGIDLTTVRLIDHGDPSGGVLLTRAGAAATEYRTSLADGLVHQHEHGVPTGHTEAAVAARPSPQQVRARQ